MSQGSAIGSAGIEPYHDNHNQEEIMFGNDALFLQRLLKCIGFYTGDLDGDFGPLTDEALRRLEDETDRIADEEGHFDLRSEKNIMTLHPQAQILARRFMGKVKADPQLSDAGVVGKIISGTRTYQEQAALFALGRTRPGRIVTNASAGRSNHNFGIAWDLGLFKGPNYLQESTLYDVTGDIGRDLGLEWGGDWSSFVDKPHFQLKTLDTLAQVREKFESGVNFV
jgi:peptidoglycan L-alanyl-D-glutamate endopeptidase CwlK